MSAARNLSNNEDQYFELIAKKMSEITGVQLGGNNLHLVKARLSRRMYELGIKSAQDYWNYIQSNESSELDTLTALLTTHHTFFFREFIHFEFVREQLSEIVQKAKSQGRNTVDIWCAACSRGQEVYSFAMLIDEVLKQIDPKMRFTIMGSDIDPHSVKIAQNGVYKWDEVKKMPTHYIKNHCSRGTGEIKDFVKIKKGLRENCSFKTINLLHFSKEIPNTKFDLIICRNVFIYFTNAQIQSITRKMMKHLHPHGFLITGLSENISRLDFSGRHIGHSIYSPSPETEKSTHTTTTPKTVFPKKTITPTAPTNIAPLSTSTESNPVLKLKAKKKLRVLCVDDSPTVLAIMKKILNNDQFEVVATAKHGLEAKEMVKTHNPDVLTLDIHMPEQNGIEYLAKNFSKNHPPVVVVSSVSREDAGLALQALENGATDYVEKPTLENLETRADEIRTKLNCAYRMKDLRKEQSVDKMTKSFAKKPIITKTDEKLRIIVASVSEKKKILSVLKETLAPQPPTLVLIESPGNILPSWTEQIQSQIELSTSSSDTVPDLYSNKVYFLDLKHLPEIIQKHSNKKTTISIIGDVSKHNAQLLLQAPNAQLIVEDFGEYLSDVHRSLSSVAAQVIPYTSFSYESDKLFCE